MTSQKTRIFLNSLDSWFSNFVIEGFRTDHLRDNKHNVVFMGTINDLKNPNPKLPAYFKPTIVNFDFNSAFKSEIFSNDVFIYNIDEGNAKELQYIINGLKKLRVESEKIIIIISNLLTWANTPDKLGFPTEGKEFILPEDSEIYGKYYVKTDNDECNIKDNINLNNVNEVDDINQNEKISPNNQETKNNTQLHSINNTQNNSMTGDINNQDNNNNNSNLDNNQTTNDNVKNTKDNQSNNSLNTKKCLYYTDKDYIKRKPDNRYLQYIYLENEILNLNHKANIKSYVICPGIIYGYGEQTLFSIFRKAILNEQVSDILLPVYKNIIPTIHMKDLITIIGKIIEKKPSNHYIVAFDFSENKTFGKLIRDIYNVVGSEKNMYKVKEVNKAENIEGAQNIEGKEDIKENKDKDKEIQAKENSENVNDNNQNEAEGIDGNKEDNENKVLTIKEYKPFEIPEYFNIDLLFLNIKLLPSDWLKGELNPKIKEKIEKEATQINEGKEQQINDPENNATANVAENNCNNSCDNNNNNINQYDLDNLNNYIPLFKWHSQFGISSNKEALRKEFLNYRNLSQNRICIIGNPYSGKSTLAEKLKDFFKLPLITLKDISDFGKNLVKESEEENKKIQEENNEGNIKDDKKDPNDNAEQIDNANKANIDNITNINNENLININKQNTQQSELIQELKDYLKDLEAKKIEAEDNYNKRKDKKKTDPPFDEDHYMRFTDELLIKILKYRLTQNDAFMYGFILDGIPKNYIQAKNFLDDITVGLGNVEKQIDPIKLTNTFYINSIIKFIDVDDDFIMSRIKGSADFPKDPKDPKVTAILDRANRRLGKVKESKTQEEYKSIDDYFAEESKREIFRMIDIDTKLNYDEIFNMCKDFVVANNGGKINRILEELDFERFVLGKTKDDEQNLDIDEQNLQTEGEENSNKLKDIEDSKDKIGNIKESDNPFGSSKDINKDINNIKNSKIEESTKNVVGDINNSNNDKSKISSNNNQNITNNPNEITKVEHNTPKKSDEKQIIDEKIFSPKEETPKTPLEIEKENEFKLLEKKSEVLRRYLAENVLPLLSLGVLHVCNTLPDDPVEAMADFLLAKTFENQVEDKSKSNLNKIEKIGEGNKTTESGFGGDAINSGKTKEINRETSPIEKKNNDNNNIFDENLENKNNN